MVVGVRMLGILHKQLDVPTGKLQDWNSSDVIHDGLQGHLHLNL